MHMHSNKFVNIPDYNHSAFAWQSSLCWIVGIESEGETLFS